MLVTATREPFEFQSKHVGKSVYSPFEYDSPFVKFQTCTEYSVEADAITSESTGLNFTNAALLVCSLYVSKSCDKFSLKPGKGISHIFTVESSDAVAKIVSLNGENSKSKTDLLCPFKSGVL